MQHNYEAHIIAEIAIFTGRLSQTVVVKELNKLSESLRLGVALGVLLSLSAAASAQGKGVRDNLFKMLDWNGYDVSAVLTDGTSMYSYVAEAPNLPVADSDKAEHQTILRFTFFPRFKCSPLIELISVMPENITKKKIMR